MEQQIYLIGLNYRTAGVEVRERFALTDHCSKDTWAIPLRPSGENDSAETTLDEALILSTCNRVEILAVGQGDVPGLILEAWASAKNRKAVELAPYVYIHKGREAIAHLFTVASSLDSMVLGEPQILGQLKGAYRKATLAGTDIVGDCLYFYAPALSQGTWIRSNRTYYTTIGCHRFYL